MNDRDRLQLSVHLHDLENDHLPADWVPHVILAQEVIEHISQAAAKRFLKEAYELLPPGGKLFLSTPNPKKPEQQFVWPESHVYEYALDELLVLVEEVGFEVKSITGWFSQQEDRKNRMTPEAKALFKRLNEGSLAIASSVIGFLYPELAKGVCLTLRKPGDVEVVDGYS
jgi:predicted SAM-dependent methyltransferase